MKKPLVWFCLFPGCGFMLFGQEKQAAPGAGAPGLSVKASREEPFVNSLGMKFVPVPGTKALFSLWETRLCDYLAYAKANPRKDYETTVRLDGTVGLWWKNPGFKQGDNDPVVYVNWQEALAFCAWLTRKERAEGAIGKDEGYRLPTDEEWGAAAGTHKYPWGDDWPPPKGAMNEHAPTYLPGGMGQPAPVGSYAANQYGLYDITGNVREWCQGWDPDNGEIKALLGRENLEKSLGPVALLRGACWRSTGAPRDLLLASSRMFYPASFRRDDDGFRCVLAPKRTSFTLPKTIFASDIEWKEAFGGYKPGGIDGVFCLMAHGALQSPVSPGMDAAIKRWLAAHPKAVATPVYRLTPLTENDVDSEFMFVWVADGREKLNVELVRQGIVYPETQLLDKSDPLEVPQAEYDDFAKQITAAGDHAKTDKLGLWKTGPPEE